ncbi:hypothetical protein E2C01_024646 [Portunus trituberculatus]|uniref:Uncharacterized protein n=1 Tax=Portunus trituberculatus TaxID=210409 RepID=A0A5B7EDE1_PORTR|nr:hypothetical protein [Portunus trituberculatus]
MAASPVTPSPPVSASGVSLLCRLFWLEKLGGGSLLCVEVRNAKAGRPEVDESERRKLNEDGRKNEMYSDSYSSTISPPHLLTLASLTS